MVQINSAEELVEFVNDCYLTTTTVEVMGKETKFGAVEIDSKSFIATSTKYRNLIFIMGSKSIIDATYVLGILKGAGKLTTVWGAEIPAKMADELVYDLLAEVV